jgi:hypothetical protein
VAVAILYFGHECRPRRPSQSWALKNVSGEHYLQPMDSDAFYRADRFEDVIAGIERALTSLGELAPERARVTRDVLGVVDGRAGERIADTIAVVA